MEFSDKTTGTLGIQIAQNDEGKRKLRKKGIEPQGQLTVPQIETREMAMQKQGINYKLISITSDYLDEWMYDFVLVPQSLHRKDVASKEQAFMLELQQMATFFPEWFAANKPHYLKELLALRNKNIEELQPPPPPQMETGTPLMQGEELMQPANA